MVLMRGGTYLKVEYNEPFHVFPTGNTVRLFATSLRGRNSSLAVEGTNISTV